MTTRRIIVGVDFGAVYSKVSWAIDGSDKQVHLIDDWPDPAAPNATREEVPSSISYNREGEVCDWGYHVNPGVDAVKIDRFKMLVNRTNFDLHLELQNSCQDWPVRLQGSSFAVVSDYLRCIWNHTKAHISKHRGDRWESLYYPLVIFTVPGFWDMSSTQQLMMIASDAGLPLNRTFISEPKATALALFKGLVPMEGIHSWRSDDIVIVCDTGACTMDVTSYQIITSWPLELEEFMPGRAELHGSTVIDRYFENIVRTQIGPSKYDSILPTLKFRMLEQFETMKRSFSATSAEGFTVDLPNIGKGETEGNRSQPVHFDPATLRTIFDNVCERIICALDDKIKEAISHQLGVKSIILTGGLGSSKYLYHRLVQLCRVHEIQVLQPHRSWFATCRGATLWGLQKADVIPEKSTPHQFTVSKDIGSPRVAPSEASVASERTYQTARTFQSTVTLESTMTFKSAVSDTRRLTFGFRAPVHSPRDPRYYRNPESRTSLSISSRASGPHENQSPINEISRSKLPQNRILIASPGDLELCREPWLLSALLTWLKLMCEKVKSFQRQHLVTALQALLSSKVPGVPLEYVKILSEQIVYKLESGEDPAVIWNGGNGRWTSNSCSGVLPELTGRGCYSPRSHTASYKTPLACYSILCCSAQSMSPWLKCLRSFSLVPELNKEQNWSGRGQHAEFSAEETLEVPLLYERSIGHGAFGSVDSVRCGRIRLARKKIRCSRRLKREDALKEVAHLQLLSHAHLVQVIGTYVFNNRQDLHILLYPVTEYDLEDFMESIHEEETGETEQRLCDLYSFFPCLVNTLSYIHGHCIKHMDIKPRNILVRDMRKSSMRQSAAFSVYLADFGIARSYSSAEDAETSSPTAFPRLYAAPEVVAQETRGFGADIFSLGCVFAEMAAVITGQQDELAGARLNSFQQNLEPTKLFLRRLLLQKVTDDITIWIKEILVMLEHDPKRRPSAKQICKRVEFCWTECCFWGPNRLEGAVIS